MNLHIPPSLITLLNTRQSIEPILIFSYKGNKSFHNWIRPNKHICHISPLVIASDIIRRDNIISRRAFAVVPHKRFTKTKKRQIRNLSFCHQSLVLRRERDSNPRNLAVQRFSRPPQSTTLPSLRDKSSFFFGFRQIFLSTSAAQGIIPQYPGASLIPTSGPTACPEAG